VCDEKIPLLMADAEQLKRVFVNLIENAVESFSEDLVEKLIEIRISYRSEQDSIEFVVSDNGQGIPSVDLPRVFQPYFSTKGRGTGLGLAIVHRIIRDHYGQISVGQNDPCGTTFTVSIPIQSV
jgi:signal transduction histidine kinase